MSIWISKKALMLTVSAVMAVWIGEELYFPRHHDLHRFDPRQVAALETNMWRSYYDHHAFDLFTELTQLLRQQYGMPFWRSVVAGYHAARAAEVFQRGHARSEYHRVLPDLTAYYRWVSRSSTSGFNPDVVARLELEWWILHRQRDRYAAGSRNGAGAPSVRNLRAASRPLRGARTGQGAGFAAKGGKSG